MLRHLVLRHLVLLHLVVEYFDAKTMSVKLGSAAIAASNLFVSSDKVPSRSVFTPRLARYNEDAPYPTIGSVVRPEISRVVNQIVLFVVCIQL